MQLHQHHAATMPAYAGWSSPPDARLPAIAMHPDAVRDMMDDWSSLSRTESLTLAGFCQKWIGADGAAFPI